MAGCGRAIIRTSERFKRSSKPSATGGPAAPTTSDRTIIEHHDRKPGPGMLQKAAREMLLDLSRSWIIGDMHSDMLAGRNAGLRGTILVRTGQGDTVDHQDPAVDHVATDLLEASRLIARLEIPSTAKNK